jgi:hypothetical protein
VAVVAVALQAAQVVHLLAVRVRQELVTVQQHQPTQHLAVAVQQTTEQQHEQVVQAVAE